MPPVKPATNGGTRTTNNERQFMADKPKKTLFHSELVQLGAVKVLVKTDVMKSKFAGKLPYVVLECDGMERNLSLENKACEEAMAGLKGKIVVLEAAGSRDDATITIAGATTTPEERAHAAAATNKPPPAKASPPATHQAPPATTAHKPDSADQIIAFKKFIARRGNALALCAAETCRTVETFCKLTGLPFGDNERSVIRQALAEKLTETTFTTLFITADRAGQCDDFPSGGNLHDLVEYAKKRAAEQHTSK